MLKQKPILIALIVAVAIVSSATIRWQSGNAKFGLGFDQMASVSLSTQAFLDLKTGHYAGYNPEGYKEANRCPPFPFYVSGLVMALFGPSFEAMSSTNLLFFLAFLAAVYLLAARRGGPAAGGIALSAILLTKAYSKYLLTWNSDMAGAAVVAWTIVLLDNPQNETPLWKLALLGLVYQLGIQTRLTYPLFVLAPAGYLFYREAVEKYRQSKKDLWIVPVRWLVPFILFRFSRFLVGRDRSLWGEVSSVELGEIGSSYAHFHTLQGIPFYLDWWHELGPILLVFGLIGLGWTFRQDRKNFWLLFFWLAVPAAGFACFAVNATRHMLPAFGALAVFAAMPVRALEPRKAGHAFLAVLAVALFLFFRTTDNPAVTQPPTFGAGWEAYDARDFEVADFLAQEPGPILLVDRFAQRIFSTYMLPSRIVFQNPDRPFFKIGYEYEYEQIQEVYDLMGTAKSPFNTVVIRQPVEEETTWEEGGARRYFELIASMGRLNLEKTYDLMKKIMATTKGMNEVFEGDYVYGNIKMKVLVLKKE